MKVYPWKGLKGRMEDKYGLFPDIKNIGIGWPVQNTYDSPLKLGEEFGSFILEKHLSTRITLEHVLPEKGKQKHIVEYVNSGRVESLKGWEFGSFEEGLLKGFKKGHHV